MAKIKYMEWFKFGGIYGFLEALLIAIIAYFGMEAIRSYLPNYSASLGTLFTGVIGAMFIIFTIITGLFAMLGAFMEDILNLKLSGFMKKIFIMVAPGVLFSFLTKGISLSSILGALVSGVVFTWLTIQSYHMFKWRLPK